MWFDESGLRWKEGTVAWRPGGPARALTTCAAGVGAAIWEESYDHAIQSSHRSRCCHSRTLRHERPRCHFGFGCFILVGAVRAVGKVK